MCYKMDFKKLASDAGTLFSRAKQFTEEKLGQAERTELDAHVENLLQKADRTKFWTERVLSQTEAVLQPNPSVRLEEFIYEKVQGKKPIRLVEDDVLGQHMIEAGNEFGPGTPYGGTLVRCGQMQQNLGQTRRQFIETAASDLLQPFNAFLEGDMKTIQKERRIMETKRLDLDAAKSRLRRAKSQQAKESAETDLRLAQSEFDRHVEVTRLLLEGLSSSYAHHQRCLLDFIEAQATYYAQCHKYVVDLQQQLGIPGNISATSTTTSNVAGYNSASLASAAAGPAEPPPACSAAGSNWTPTQIGVPSANVECDLSGMTELSLSNDEDVHVFDQ